MLKKNCYKLTLAMCGLVLFMGLGCKAKRVVQYTTGSGAFKEVYICATPATDEVIAEMGENSNNMVKAAAKELGVPEDKVGGGPFGSVTPNTTPTPESYVNPEDVPSGPQHTYLEAGMTWYCYKFSHAPNRVY